MEYFDRAYVVASHAYIDLRKSATEPSLPDGFPQPHIINGHEMWSKVDLTAWQQCQLLEAIKITAETVMEDLQELMDLLAAL